MNLFALNTEQQPICS